MAMGVVVRTVLPHATPVNFSSHLLVHGEVKWRGVQEHLRLHRAAADPPFDVDRQCGLQDRTQIITTIDFPESVICVIIKDCSPSGTCTTSSSESEPPLDVDGQSRLSGSYENYRTN